MHLKNTKSEITIQTQNIFLKCNHVIYCTSTESSHKATFISSRFALNGGQKSLLTNIDKIEFIQIVEMNEQNHHNSN